MSDVNALAKERFDLYKDLFGGNVPARVPVNNPLTLDAMFEYTGANVAEVYWDMTKAEAVFDKVCADFPADSIPGGTRRYPSFYQLLGYRGCMMSSTGNLNSPEVIGLEADDYDYLISSPYDCLVERALPRLCSELDNTSPEHKFLAMSKAFSAWRDEMASVGGLIGKIRDRYGFPMISRSQTLAPFDCLSDFLRGFSGISLDLRRVPDKVKAAAEAVTPLMIKRGHIPQLSELNLTLIPLHMAPYLRQKDAEQYFFPTLLTVVNALNEMGHTVELSLQVKYDRFIDCLQDFPENTILVPEQSDDYQAFKDKLGKKFIISGLYPVALLMTGTKGECVDKAKEMLDIFAPGGKYLFGFDKGIMNLTGNTAENLRAVLEYVYNNATYTPEQRSGNSVVKQKPSRSAEIIEEANNSIKSKYYTPWAQYKENHPELYKGLDDVIGSKIMRYEDAMFSFIINKIS